MSKNHLKGQSATEYLMTYGWAILAIVIVAGILWNMGIFGGAGCQESLRGFAGSKVYVDTVVVHANGQVDIHAKNAAGVDITVWTNPGPDSNGDGIPDSYGGSASLPANSKATIQNVYNATYGGMTSGNPGDCYSGVDIIIKYEVNGLNLTSSGKASGTIQP